MTGRAGRRGKDKVGFVLIIPRHPRDFERAKELAESEPEDLRSALSRPVLPSPKPFGNDGLRGRIDRFWTKVSPSTRWRGEATGEREPLGKSCGWNSKGGQVCCKNWATLPKIGTQRLSASGGLLIRHERSLFIVEAVRQGLMDTLSPEGVGWLGCSPSLRSAHPATL
jgi:hypothetical protein